MCRRHDDALAARTAPRSPARGRSRRRTGRAGPGRAAARRPRRRPRPRSPAGRASSAVTGTTSAWCTVPVVIATCTGAWSRWPVARGCRGRMETLTVGAASLPGVAPSSALDAVATRPTRETTPRVTRLSASVMSTRRRRGSAPWRSASSATTTSRSVDVARPMGPGAAAPPSVAETDVIRAARGRKTAAPSASEPVWVTPRCRWRRRARTWSPIRSRPTPGRAARAWRSRARPATR